VRISILFVHVIRFRQLGDVHRMSRPISWMKYLKNRCSRTTDQRLSKSMFGACCVTMPWHPHPHPHQRQPLQPSKIADVPTLVALSIQDRESSTPCASSKVVLVVSGHAVSYFHHPCMANANQEAAVLSCLRRACAVLRLLIPRLAPTPRYHHSKCDAPVVCHEASCAPFHCHYR
jgi:hypothetical protein